MTKKIIFTIGDDNSIQTQSEGLTLADLLSVVFASVDIIKSQGQLSEKEIVGFIDTHLGISKPTETSM